MARINPVNKSELSPAVQSVLENRVKEKELSIVNCMGTLGHSEAALQAYSNWYPLYEEVKKILGTRLANLFAYSISSASDCTLCTAFFRQLITKAGEDPDSLFLTESQKDVLDFGAGIARYHGNIYDYLYDTVARRYSKQEMVTLVAFAGQMIAANVFNNVVETDIHEINSKQ